MLAPMILANWHNLSESSASAGETTGATFAKRLSQARDGFQITFHQLEAASFIVVLQIHCLTQFQTCVNGTSRIGRVFMSGVRRRASRAFSQAREPTGRQVEVARFTGECVYLQIHGLTQFRNLCNRTERHSDGLHFQCTSSRRRNSLASKRWSPDHCPSTRSCQFHCRHSNSQTHSIFNSCNRKERHW